MTSSLDATHDPALRSWVPSANGHRHFPIQNLPLGVFVPPGGGAPRGGVAIGDEILDLAALARSGLAPEASEALAAASGATLNDLFALGAGPRRALRAALSRLLAAGASGQAEVARMLRPARDCEMRLPARIGDYTDFYVGIHHATNVGKLFRPDNPLLPNYKHVPIGYHGRASTIVVSGTAFRRPKGQRKRPDEAEPSFGPCRSLDLELEIGVWIGKGSGMGEGVAIGEAEEHIAGYCLLNDWSARDIQAWEYQPLGPFLAKNFATTISPWVITPEALAPFRIAAPARPAGDPAPLPYLLSEADQRAGGLDIELDVELTTAVMRKSGLAAHRLATSSTRHMYWTVAQMVAHHTCNGCGLNPGDLLGSGTLSAPERGGYGSLLEIALGGKEPIGLPSGETRAFLEDGDEIVLRAFAAREGAAAIGFGECRGMILPSS